MYSSARTHSGPVFEKPPDMRIGGLLLRAYMVRAGAHMLAGVQASWSAARPGAAQRTYDPPQRPRRVKTPYGSICDATTRRTAR